MSGFRIDFVIASPVYATQSNCGSTIRVHARPGLLVVNRNDGSRRLTVFVNKNSWFSSEVCKFVEFDCAPFFMIFLAETFTIHHYLYDIMIFMKAKNRFAFSHSSCPLWLWHGTASDFTFRLHCSSSFVDWRHIPVENKKMPKCHRM